MSAKKKNVFRKTPRCFLNLNSSPQVSQMQVGTNDIIVRNAFYQVYLGCKRNKYSKSCHITKTVPGVTKTIRCYFSLLIVLN
jgi:hypothetical protein